MPSQPFFDITSLSPLYEDVQLARIFPDSKFFVDCSPAIAPEVILTSYATEKTQRGFHLLSFVSKHFIFPVDKQTGYTSANKPLAQHLSDLWHVLSRAPGDEQHSTLIPLPHPYIVPGGRFREIYYWDSYFTMLGLQVARQTDMMENMVANFAHLIHTVGFIPNGNRTYYLGRSQPPFFSLMVALLQEEKGQETMLRYKDALEKEYHFWMSGHRVVQMPNGLVMNRYWDDYDTPRPEAYIEDIEIAHQANRPANEVYRHIRAAAESGWDFSSRWFGDGENMTTIQTTDIIPADLNCLLLFLETSLRSIYQELNDQQLADQFLNNIRRRKEAIQEYCWNQERGFYFDYNIKEQRFSDAYTLAAAYPLFFNIADQNQARQVALLINEKFMKPGGLVTTLNFTGQQWDAPLGWAPLQWIAYKGLRNYAFDEIARQVKHCWLQTNEKTYEVTGKMMEKYNVADVSSTASGGEYPNQDGFGWTNGVYLKLKNM